MEPPKWENDGKTPICSAWALRSRTTKAEELARPGNLAPQRAAPLGLAHEPRGAECFGPGLRFTMVDDDL